MIEVRTDNPRFNEPYTPIPPEARIKSINKLIDKLVQKGIMTKEEADSL